MDFGALEQQYGLPPGLLAAVMQAESGGNPNAVSPKGAQGAFQFMPATAQQYGVSPNDAASAAAGAAKMFADLSKKYGGDVPKMLAAYNWGQGNVDRLGLAKAPSETQGYIQKVTSAMQIDPSKVQWDAPAIDPSKVQWDQPQSADASLGGTLQLGIPFTGARLNTGIPLSPAVEAGLVEAGKGTDRLIQGVRQLLPGSNANLDQQVSADNAAVAPLEQAHPIATTLGGMAPYLAATNPVTMALMAGIAYGTPAQRAESAGLAFLGGKVGQGVGRLFGPQSMAGAADNGLSDFIATNTANKWGIPLRMAQTTDSKPIQIIDAVAQNLPLTSGVINKAKTATYQAFNNAVGKTFGADTTQITPELLGQSKDIIGSTIGGLAERNTLNLDPQLAQDIARVTQWGSKNLSSDDARILGNQVTEL